MQVRPEQLEQHLKQGVAPCYLVTGAEPLIIQECTDAIRAAARAAGCVERERINAADKDGWQSLIHSASSMSLFADRKLIEIQVDSGKPGAEGSKVLQEYLALGSDNVLLVVAGKIDKQSQNGLGLSLHLVSHQPWVCWLLVDSICVVGLLQSQRQSRRQAIRGNPNNRPA